MRVAVITPYYKEQLATLRRCHESVRAQTHACSHFLVADGHPQTAVEGWPVEHIVLPSAHGDNGNTPRTIGAISALNRGYDGFAFLDADNWYAPSHVANAVKLAKERRSVFVFSDRTNVSREGEILADAPEDLLRQHVDTSCIFHTAAAAKLIPLWAMMDQPLSPLCDRILFSQVIAHGYPYQWTGERTVFFESLYSVHYTLAGRRAPPDVHDIDFGRVLARYSPDRCRERLGYAFDVQYPGSGAAPRSSSSESSADV